MNWVHGQSLMNACWTNKSIKRCVHSQPKENENSGGKKYKLLGITENQLYSALHTEEGGDLSIKVFSIN